jgi:hypothetical protein
VQNKSFFLILLTLGACSGGKIQKEKLEKIQKVAVIGFTVYHRTPNSAKSVVAALSDDDSGRPIAAEIAKDDPFANDAYAKFGTMLANKTRWRVVDQKTLSRNPEYAEWLSKSTKGLTARPLVNGPNWTTLKPAGIVEAFTAQNISRTDRQKILKALGVDAVIVLSSRIDLNHRGILKITGTLHPASHLEFYLWDAVNEDPLWFELNAAAESDVGVKHEIGFSDLAKILPLSKDAFQQSVVDLLKKYN